MTTTAMLEISLLPDPLRAQIAAGYREMSDANRMLHAETGFPRFLELAVYAAGRADAHASYYTQHWQLPRQLDNLTRCNPLRTG